MEQAKNDEGDGVEQRDANLAEREAGLAAHLLTVEKILEAAQARDIEAEARDQISVQRDHAADRKAFTSPHANGGYGADLPARRHAALDRRDAKGDRTSSADDRAALTEVADDLQVPEKANGPEEK